MRQRSGNSAELYEGLRGVCWPRLQDAKQFLGGASGGDQARAHDVGQLTVDAALLLGLGINGRESHALPLHLRHRQYRIGHHYKERQTSQGDQKTCMAWIWDWHHSK